MYANLRTNLPREVMAYTDFPFDDLKGRSQDSRRFPSHAEVSHRLLDQLQAQAEPALCVCVTFCGKLHLLCSTFGLAT